MNYRLFHYIGQANYSLPFVEPFVGAYEEDFCHAHYDDGEDHFKFGGELHGDTVVIFWACKWSKGSKDYLERGRFGESNGTYVPVQLPKDYYLKVVSWGQFESYPDYPEVVRLATPEEIKEYEEPKEVILTTAQYLHHANVTHKCKDGKWVKGKRAGSYVKTYCVEMSQEAARSILERRMPLMCDAYHWKCLHELGVYFRVCQDEPWHKDYIGHPATLEEENTILEQLSHYDEDCCKALRDQLKSWVLRPFMEELNNDLNYFRKTFLDNYEVDYLIKRFDYTLPDLMKEMEKVLKYYKR